MAEEKTDLLAQYHSIAHKLRKKRILKKPNVAEACQQFESLGLNFEREDLAHYSGLCYQAAAKCQNSLGNTLDEGLLLLKSSRQFMSSYLENLNDNWVPNASFINHSQMVYEDCLARYCLLLSEYEDCLARLKESEEPGKLVTDALIGNIILEMGDNLTLKAGLTTEGCQEYEKALKYFSNSSVEKIYCLQKIASVKVATEDYKECLKLVNSIIKEAQQLPDTGLKESILRDSEITRIFLLLILRPTLQQISPEAASVLEKYAWVETSNKNELIDLSTALKNQGLSMLSEDLFLNLQSLVMACQYNDPEGLEILENDLIKYLSNDQKTLLQILIKEYKA